MLSCSLARLEGSRSLNFDYMKKIFQEEKKNLTVLWKRRKTLSAKRKAIQVQQNLKDAPEFFELAVPFGLAGILLLIILFPFAINSAFGTGVDGIDVLLLQKAPGGLPRDFFDHRFPDFSLPNARPILFAFGLLYGFIGIVAAIMIITGGLQKLVVTANGLLGGYYLTRFLSVEVFGILSIDAFTSNLFNLKIAYLFLIFYLAVSLTKLFGPNEYAKERYGFLFSGLGGLLSGWLLGRGFGADAAIFSGIIFYLTSFFAIWAIEIILRPIFEVIEVGIGEEYWKSFARERSYSFSNLKRLAIEAYRADKIKFLVGFFITLIFPFFTLVIYMLLF